MRRACLSLSSTWLVALLGAALSTTLVVACGGGGGDGGPVCEGRNCGSGTASSSGDASSGVGGSGAGGSNTGGTNVGGSSASSSTGSGNTGGNSNVADCVPSEAMDPVKDNCGVFVKAGSTGGDGTKAKPFGSLTEAIAPAAASTKRVYICTDTLMEMDEVVVPAGFFLYGGLDCNNDWKYVGVDTKSPISAPPGKITLRLQAGAAVTEVHDIHVIAEAGNQPGQSSIAVLADAAHALFVGARIEARAAADGAEGEPYQTAAASGMNGSPGLMACSAATVLGAEGPLNMCGAEMSVGGPGGGGAVAQGNPGGSGLPGDDTNPNGGNGETNSQCTPGKAGVNGANGEAAVDMALLGEINAVDGYKGVPGVMGMPGKVGQGGGGGGGAKGGSSGNKCDDPASAGGASGGSGAAGGCGGDGGNGGSPGGSSIGIVSLASELSFMDTTITAGNGANGGLGGPGQDGGKGGLGGAGGTKPGGAGQLKNGCSGGVGGNGGKGGSGSRGSPGHSIGIAYLDPSPALAGVTIQIANPGEGGMAADVFKFEPPMP